MSRNARTSESSYTMLEGIYLRIILSNIVQPACISWSIVNNNSKITNFCPIFFIQIINIKAIMDEQQTLKPQHPYFTYQYPTLNTTQPQFQPLTPVTSPILNKITTDPSTSSLYAAYSDGKVLRYNAKTSTLTNVFSIYDKTDVIDIQARGRMLVTCSHAEITVFDIEKEKSMALKGHEETPISASMHPMSPLIVSVSNLVIQHDLRMRKPINVNFITPPVYNIKFFADGSYYFLSGEPCRVGRNTWVRTLLNGIGSVSDNCKYIAVNEMNGNLVLWNWRKSTREVVVPYVKNQEIYQSIYFRKQEGEIRGLIFLEDDGNLLEHDLISNRTNRRSILSISQTENWKIHVDSELNTQHIYAYQHEKSIIKCYLASTKGSYHPN